MTQRARPRSSRLVVAGALGLVGGIWVGQGLGYIPGSFMTGDPFWAFAGAVLIIGAAILVVSELRRSP